MSVQHALLALLASGPRHGYQLKVEFDAATGGAAPLNFGQVYPTLQRLQKSGYVSQLEAPSDDDRAKTSFAITDNGRGQLKRWLSEPTPPPRTSRDELTVKILLAIETNEEDPLAIINTQRDATLAELQTIVSTKAQTEDLAALIDLDRQAMTAESEIRWLDLVEDRLANAPVADQGESS